MSVTADTPGTTEAGRWFEELPPVAPPEQQASTRDDRLQRVLGRARRGGTFTEQWLLAAGGALVVAGIALVVIGWVGTSRTILVAGQIPYLVSGGLLGLALVFVGAFLYFGYWLATLVRDSRDRAAQDRADLARVAAGLDDVNRSLSVVAQLLEQDRRGRRFSSGS